MSIEEQIAALEARIQAAMLVIAGSTDQAEAAAQRAELAAQRAELAALGSQQAEVASVVAAAAASESMTISAEAAVEAAEIMEEIEEIVEEGAEIVDAETEQPEIPVQDGGREENEETQPGLQPGPIVIQVEERHRPEPTLFKPNHTRFRRGRAS